MAGQGGVLVRYADATRVRPITPSVLLDIVPDDLEKAGRGEIRAGKVSYGALFDQYQQTSYYNSLYGKGMQKPFGTPDYQYLRNAFDVSTIDRVIVGARKNQVRHISRLVSPQSRDLGVSVRHVDFNDQSFDTGSPEIADRQIYGVSLLKRFDKKIHKNFTNFLVAATEDLLVYDRIALCKEHNALGEVGRYWLLDPIHIRPVLEVLIPEMLKMARQIGLQGQDAIDRIKTDASMLDQVYSEIYKQTGLDLTNAAWVQVINDRITAAWSEDQMSVFITNPQNRLNHLYYGKSPFEDSLEFTDLFLAAWQYNRQLFNQEYPENLLVLPGGYNKQTLEEFRSRLKAAGKNQDKRLGIISFEHEDMANGGAMIHKLRESPKDMMFIDMLMLTVNLKAAVYRMHPSVINIRDQGGTGISFQQAGSEELKISMSNEEGFHALAFTLCSWLTEDIVGPVDEEMMVVPLNIDRQDPVTQADVLQKDETMTVNEKRVARGQKPLPAGDLRGDRLASEVGVQIDTALDQKEMQQKQMDQDAAKNDADSQQQQGQDADANMLDMIDQKYGKDQNRYGTGAGAEKPPASSIGKKKASPAKKSSMAKAMVFDLEIDIEEVLV